MKHVEGRGGQKDAIKVVVSVERPSQRAILLGAGGRAIKQLASASRASIEAFLQRPVFLEVFIDVVPGWRTDAAAVDKAGVSDANTVFRDT